MNSPARFVLPLVMAMSLVWSSAVLATHQANHRYNVMGYVLDAQKRPIANSAVVIRMQNRVVGQGKTSSRGFYNILVHLHDSALGQQLRVHTAGGDATVRAKFTPGDTVTKREHYVNFIGGKLVEKKLAGKGFPSWGYGVIAVAVIVPAVLLLGRTSKRPSKGSRKGKSSKGQKKKKR